MMNPREFRELASELAANASPTAAELRTAVSRAYYAIYHVAVALLKKMGVKPPASWEGHKLVGVALRYGGDGRVSIPSRELDEIRSFRWAADYDMEADAVEDQRTVQKLVARTKQAIKKLDACEADPARFMEARIKIRNWAGSAEGVGKGFTLL